jgi:hypothetical protein
MTAEEHIRKLSHHVADAPEGIEDFSEAIDELRAALKASSESGDAKITVLQSSLRPHSFADMGPFLFSSIFSRSC